MIVGLQARPPGCTLEVRVVPGSPRCAVEFDATGRLKIRLDAPPVDGEANDRLVRYLAREVLSVPRSAVTLVRGERSRNKVVGIDLDIAAVELRIRAAISQ